MDSQKQTGKQSGEVVENTCLWKKQTENKATDVVENKAWLKTGQKTNRRNVRRVNVAPANLDPGSGPSPEENPVTRPS